MLTTSPFTKKLTNLFKSFYYFLFSCKILNIANRVVCLQFRQSRKSWQPFFKKSLKTLTPILQSKNPTIKKPISIKFKTNLQLKSGSLEAETRPAAISTTDKRWQCWFWVGKTLAANQTVLSSINLALIRDPKTAFYLSIPNWRLSLPIISRLTGSWLGQLRLITATHWHSCLLGIYTCSAEQEAPVYIVGHQLHRR